MKRLLSFLIVIALFGAACSDSDDPIVLNLGIVQSQTGVAAVYGKSAINGAELAIKQLSTDDLQINVTVMDDRSTAEGGISAFAALSGQNVDAIIGPTLTGVALEAQKISQASHIPTLAATNTGEGITNTGTFIFRTALTEEVVVPPALQYVHRQNPIRQAVLVVDSSDAFSRSSAAAMKKGMQAIGASVLQEIDVANGADYAGTFAGLRETPIDALLLTPLVDLSGPIVRTVRNQGFTQPIIGGNSFNTLDMVAKSSGAINGAYVGASWNPTSTNVMSQRFVADYMAAYGSAPDLYAAQGYAAVQVLVTSVLKAGTVEAEALRSALASAASIETIFGAISMSASREALYQPVVQQFRNGSLVVVQ